MKRFDLFLFIIICFWNIASFIYPEAISVEDYVLKVSKSTTLEINNKNGSVQIGTWFRDYVKISVKKVSFSWEAKDELELVELVSRKDTEKNSLIIDTNYNVDIDKVFVYLKIWIPDGLPIGRIDSANGKIRIEGAKGDVVLTTSVGKIEAVNIKGNIEAKTSNGIIILDNITGDCMAETTNGVISVYDSVGNFALSNTNGKIDVMSVKGNISAFLNVGDISVSNTEGKLDLETTTGVIKVNNNVGDANLLTSYGKIDVENVKGLVYARNDNGKIKIMDSKGVIKAKTINGNIYAEIYNVHEDGTSITTDNGSIKVGLSEELNAEIELKSIKGKIDTDELPDIDFDELSFGHKTGILGIGGPKIFIKSRNGRIKVLWL